MSHASDVVVVFLQCTLASQLDLADGKLPPGYRVAPVVAQVPFHDLSKHVDAYTSFLRKQLSIVDLRRAK